jgi:hypothetical protein
MPQNIETNYDPVSEFDLYRKQVELCRKLRNEQVRPVKLSTENLAYALHLLKA